MQEVFQLFEKCLRNGIKKSQWPVCDMSMQMNFTGGTQIPSHGRSSPAKPVSACGAVVCTNAVIPFSVWKRKTEYWREYLKLS